MALSPLQVKKEQAPHSDDDGCKLTCSDELQACPGKRDIVVFFMAHVPHVADEFALQRAMNEGAYLARLMLSGHQAQRNKGRRKK